MFVETVPTTQLIIEKFGWALKFCANVQNSEWTDSLTVFFLVFPIPRFPLAHCFGFPSFFSTLFPLSFSLFSSRLRFPLFNLILCLFSFYSFFFLFISPDVSFSQTYLFFLLSFSSSTLSFPIYVVPLFHFASQLL